MVTAIRRRTAVEMIREQRNAIIALASEYGATNVRVLPHAKGSFREEDDNELDLLATFEPNRELLDRAALSGALSELLSLEVTVLADTNLQSDARESFLAEAVAL